MIPGAFDYVSATSVPQVLALLAEHGDEAVVLAGGHTLLPTLKLRLSAPRVLIDVQPIKELRGIVLERDAISIGALTTHYELETSELLRAYWPIFQECANVLADPLVRNRGTIGGSLVNADPAADWPAIMLALDARFTIEGLSSRRTVAARDFFLDLMSVALEHGELLTEIRVPLPAPANSSGYRKIRHPASGFAVIGVAASLTIRHEKFAAVSIGITGLAENAFRASEVETLLRGQSVHGAVIAKAADSISAERNILSDGYAPADYRLSIARTETRRLLARLALADSR